MKGQVALVTGSARGIGKEIARVLAHRGASVIISDVNLQQAEETALEIEKETTAGQPVEGQKIEAVKFDVSNSAEVETAFAGIAERLGRLDVLVNNAGITRDALILRMKDDDWDSVLNINLKSVFLCSKEAIKIMSRQRYGRIVNISSVVAFIGNPGQANYAASKAGIIGLTKTAAKEYAKRGVTINAVAPGFIVTAMTDALPDKVKQEMLATIPMGRLGEITDVANAVAFLASPQSGYITGNCIHVNGGMYM
ncbi:3-oxoacyl-ACP reductase [Candidatus Magnetobacterium bavaricum]|uniref:3-oxoacyl-[acyl-carrier-protein] reductase n=1 Tax=Candidatus Magnetobacterium bavaricum TaxID=29290 RepID=A0A0F3GUR1_9BACT|nr:3-oxoacyl-ACP reductase [Candidatus Magnetobacterium bavaricum]